MDEKTRERIKEVAKSLHALHLAASMEEALERAREIVASAKDNGKPIKELMSEVSEEAQDQGKEAEHIQKESDKAREVLSKTAHEEAKHTEHNIASAKQTKAAVKSTEEQAKFDLKVHKLEKGDVKEAVREVDELDCATKDADYIIKEAEKIQKAKKEKK